MIAAARLMVGMVHRHAASAVTVRLAGVDHVGVYEVCRCGAVRMDGDRRWRRRLPLQGRQG